MHTARTKRGVVSPKSCGLLIRRPQVRTLLGPPHRQESATTPGPVDYVALRVALGMPRAAARRVSRQVRAAAELYAAGKLTGRQLGARSRAATRAALAGGAA